MKRTAFTMIELVFVIVILGILAAIAIPKLAATRDDAQITKGRADVAAIRSAIVSERQGRLLQGNSTYIAALDQGVAANTAGVVIFDDNDNNLANGSLLQYGIMTADSNGHWMKASNTTYTYKIMGANNTFTYDSANGTFLCTSGTHCSALVN